MVKDNSTQEIREFWAGKRSYEDCSRFTICRWKSIYIMPEDKMKG